MNATCLRSPAHELRVFRHPATLWFLCLVLAVPFQGAMGQGSPAGLPPAVVGERLDQVMSVLNDVPVYYLVHAGERPVTLPTPDGMRVAPVFFQVAAAVSMSREIEAGPAAPAEEITGFVRMGLGEMYRRRADDRAAIRFLLVGEPEQIGNARRMTASERFDSVPVFAARRTSTGEYVAMRADGRSVMPVFLEAERLEEVLREVVKITPELADDVEIEVMALESLVSALFSGDLSADAVRMIPPRPRSP
jgi:hypothetical protein